MHKGKVIVEKEKYKVIDCAVCGFKHLDPIPSEKEMERYYKEKYYSEVKGRGCKEGKLIGEKRGRETELRWIEKSAYKNRAYYFELFTKTSQKPKRICDVGCGTGDFLKYMKEAGWIGFGMEPSEQAFNMAKSLGLKDVYNMTLEKFAEENSNLIGYFDAINLMGILHHVPNPKRLLGICKKFLKSNGIICIEDPNEFNALQLCAQRVLTKEMWWIVPPEHINYFNFKTHEELLRKSGFEVVLRTTDFPMELFLLMGEDYIGDDRVGKGCHQKRMRLELHMPDELRGEMYISLAKLGIGRSCIVYAKLKEGGK